MLPYFEWLQTLPIGEMIRESRWLFPVIEAVHLVAFGIAGGMVLLVCLALLGYRVGAQRISELARDVRPWFVGSLITVVLTGVLLFLSEAVKCYNSTAFRIKIAALTAAVVLTMAAHARVTADTTPRGVQKMSAAVMLLLWALVAWGGRWIGLS